MHLAQASRLENVYGHAVSWEDMICIATSRNTAIGKY